MPPPNRSAAAAHFPVRKGQLALSRDDQGANFGLIAVLFIGPWLALVIGCAADDMAYMAGWVPGMWMALAIAAATRLVAWSRP